MPSSAQLGFERGTMRLVEAAEQRDLLQRFHDREPRLVSGGSVANSVIALSQLGGQGAFIGCVGDDRYASSTNPNSRNSASRWAARSSSAKPPALAFA